MLNILKYPRFLSKMIKTNSLLVCQLCFFVIFAVLGFLCLYCSSVVAQKAQNSKNNEKAQRTTGVPTSRLEKAKN